MDARDERRPSRGDGEVHENLGAERLAQGADRLEHRQTGGGEGRILELLGADTKDERAVYAPTQCGMSSTISRWSPKLTTTASFRRVNWASTMFIAGEPMKPATN